MDEWIQLRVFKSAGTSRTIDIKLTWKAKTEIAIEGQTKKGYGGLNFRFAPREETKIFSHDGREEDSDLKQLPWTDQSAIFGNNENFSGVGIFQNANNYDFPAGWCLRHYGFLGVAWPGLKKYKMNQGDSLSLSFRIVIHNGDAEIGKVEEHFELFENPPIIELIN